MIYDNLEPKFWLKPSLTNLSGGYVIRTNSSVGRHTHIFRRNNYDPGVGPTPLAVRSGLGGEALVALHIAVRNPTRLPLDRLLRQVQTKIEYMKSFIPQAADASVPAVASFLKDIHEKGRSDDRCDVSFGVMKGGTFRAIAHFVDFGYNALDPRVVVVSKDDIEWWRLRDATRMSGEELREAAYHSARHRVLRHRVARRVKSTTNPMIYDRNRDVVYEKQEFQRGDSPGLSMLLLQSRLPPGVYLINLMPEEMRADVIRRHILSLV